IDNMGAYDSTAVNINVTNNYSYDEEGRLIKDKAEFISKIVWRVDGKVKEIQRNGGSAKWMKFDYDAMGHRIAKHVYNTAGTVLEKSTYYILDAQGNQVSMYEHVVENETVKYNLVENNIYGSSRLGSLNRKINVLTTSLAANYTQKLGAKSYELNNHLGNVLTVFTDLKIPQDTDNNGSIDAYKIQVLNTFDYSPFGVELDERTQKYVPPAPPAQTAVTVYKNSFDSPQATSNPYTGTPSNLDPNLSTTGWSRPSGTFTNFNGISGTRAIAFENTSADTSYVTLNLSVDEAKLLDIASFSFYHRSSPTGYNAYKLVINGIEVGSGSIFVSSGNTLQHTGTINVANAVSGLSGNVTVTLKLFGGLKGALGTFRMDDFVLNGYTTASENWSPAGYRYGFNGMESDPEFKGQGNSYTTEFRQYDARVGRWLSLDPLKEKFVAFNPFNFNLNNPLIFNDIKGDRPLPVNEKYNGFSWNIASGFGSRNVKGNANASKFHQGADLNTTGGGCTDFGAPVLATHDGIISKVHESTAGGAGRYVEITSPDGSFVTKYFHLSSTNVVVGQKVEEGKQIGQVGASAFGSEKGTACHLHYELKLIVKGVQVPFDVQMDSDTDANTNNNIKNLIDPQLWVNGTFKVGTQELVKIQEIPEVTVRPKEKLELKLRPIELIPIEKRELEPIKNK
ncbi:MAG: hypothetical protein RL264_428, partial [Bacteroidota bacterium]